MYVCLLIAKTFGLEITAQMTLSNKFVCVEKSVSIYLKSEDKIQIIGMHKFTKKFAFVFGFLSLSNKTDAKRAFNRKRKKKKIGMEKEADADVCVYVCVNTPIRIHRETSRGSKTSE